MKTYKHIFDEMVKEENIRQCFYEAAKHKTGRPDVAKIIREDCIDEHVKILKEILEKEEYVPPEHQKMRINEYSCGKVREIIKPEFQYEQVVHHCIVKQLQPIVMHGLYENALGSIPGRGCHSGKKRIEKWIKGYNGRKFYIIKADVRHCFDTEDIHVIEAKLRRVIKDEKFIRLCMTVMEHEATVKKMGACGGREYLSGLPLGFVTSQWFTQLNFMKFDHMVIEDWKEAGGVDHYIRYADDIVVFGRNKKKLHWLRKLMSEYFVNEMHQELKGNWQVFRFEYPVKYGGAIIGTRGRALDFMGFVFHYNRTTLRKSILKRSTRKAHRISRKERATWYDAASMMSSMGWYWHTDTYDYYKKHIEPYVNIRELKKLASKHSVKEENKNVIRMVQNGING